jgi:hypothetical protein
MHWFATTPAEHRFNRRNTHGRSGRDAFCIQRKSQIFRRKRQSQPDSGGASGRKSSADFLSHTAIFAGKHSRNRDSTASNRESETSISVNTAAPDTISAGGCTIMRLNSREKAVAGSPLRVGPDTGRMMLNTLFLVIHRSRL